VNFDLTEVQRSWRDRGTTLGRDIAPDAAAATVVAGAARTGLLDPAADLLAVAVATEALASESPAAGVIYALHSGTALAMAHLRQGDGGQAAAVFDSLFRGEAVAAVGLTSDAAPIEKEGELAGRAPWVAPITEHGVAVVGPRDGGERVAYAVSLEAPGVDVDAVYTAGLAGMICGHVTLRGAAGQLMGPTYPIMSRIRVLMAAAGLGIGRRALREALQTARAAHTAAAGEQTVQGLLADAATDLDAAMLVTWKAASSPSLSLADASLAKIMATAAAQRAVERATQVIGVDSFQRGHIIERLAQDVRALELFAGRTEALRAAVAEELLPRS
jgi:alkylation response protein AidB-like acyl-CoA dehydrogenase